MLSHSTINISLNNKVQPLPDNTTLAQAIELWGLYGELFATAINGEFVARSQYHHHHLCDGDQIDIVKPVEGG